MNTTKALKYGLALLVAASAGLVGCRNHMPHAFTWPASGDTLYTHPKPPEGGYYSNWDPYAVELEVTPLDDVNPVRTQHVLIATVRDKKGKPLPNRRIEWHIAPGSVGHIVEVDESGWRAARGYMVDGDFAVSHTNNNRHTLTRGNADPSDDIKLEKGQTWCVITSPVEGDTHITVYCPGIYDWDKHKVFAVKHWYDVKWSVPPPATNPVGTPHEMITQVTKFSDGAGLADYEVTYTVIDGPPATFTPGGGSTTTVRTDSAGMAKVTLNQSAPAEGTNNIRIDILRPANIQCCKPAVKIAEEMTSKTWIGPKIGIDKSAPASAVIGDTFTYNIVVTNPSQVATSNTVVTDTLPNGVDYVSSTPSASVAGKTLTWSLGAVAPGGSTPIAVQVKATACTPVENCAEVRADYNLSARDCAPTTISCPKLAIEKRCTPEVTQCDAIEYVIVVRNPGDGPANNINLTDQLPDGLTTTEGKTTVVSNIGTLAAGQAKEVRYTVKASRTGSFTNRVTAVGDGGLSAEASCTTVVKKPNLAVTKQGRDTLFVGRQGVYDITVTNNGDTVARGTQLVDTLPPEVTFVSADSGGSGSGNTVTWSLGDLAPGQSKKVTCTVSAQRIGKATNNVRATASCTEATAQHVMEIKGIPAILLEVVDVEDPDELGTTDVYIITVTNQGTAIDTNIRITAEVQPEADFVSAEGPVPGTAAGKVVTFQPLPTLAPKAQAVYKVTVKAVKPGDTRFKVQMSSDNIGTSNPVTETESTRFYE